MSKLSTATKSFTAIDGEGIDVGIHHYYNLIVARNWSEKLDSIFPAIKQQQRLTTWEIFEFLAKRCAPKFKNTIYVMFYFNYDITKWIEDLTTEQRTKLWKTNNLTVHAPNGYIYKLTYIPSKFFTFEFQYVTKSGKLKRNKITIYDVWSFFGTSFVKALEQWNINSGDFIKEMKQKRGTFTSNMIDEVTEYTVMECDLLCQLMEKVRNALYAEGINVKGWYGAGAIAQALFEKENTKSRIRVPQIVDNADLDGAIMGSYFGGRFEIFRKGIIDTTYQYDINSAYPFSMSQLPNFERCDIRFSSTYTRDKYSLWFVKYNILDHGTKRKKFDYYGAETFLAGPFPFRTKQGNILYPYFNPFGIWVHQVELETALSLYGADNFQILYGYIIQPKSDIPAFDFIPKLASRRLKLKKEGDDRNIVLKLALNSLYGKTAQAANVEGKTPPFQNYYIAGFITAFTRAKLLRQAFHCGNFGSGLIQFATDGIFSTVPADNIKKSSTEFGGWEYTKIPSRILYIQAGVYFSEHMALTQKRRTRGFGANSIDVEELYRKWIRFCDSYGWHDQTMEYIEKRFVGTGSCVVGDRWSKYGKFITEKRLVSFLSPPTKQFCNPGGELFFNDMAWEVMQPKLKGVTKNDVVTPDYSMLMIPNPDYIAEESMPYVSNKTKPAEEIAETILAHMISMMQMGEQPDFYDEAELEIEL